MGVFWPKYTKIHPFWPQNGCILAKMAKMAKYGHVPVPVPGPGPVPRPENPECVYTAPWAPILLAVHVGCTRRRVRRRVLRPTHLARHTSCQVLNALLAVHPPRYRVVDVQLPRGTRLHPRRQRRGCALSISDILAKMVEIPALARVKSAHTRACARVCKRGRCPNSTCRRQRRHVRRDGKIDTRAVPARVSRNPTKSLWTRARTR